MIISPAAAAYTPALCFSLAPIIIFRHYFLPAFARRVRHALPRRFRRRFAAIFSDIFAFSRDTAKIMPHFFFHYHDYFELFAASPHCFHFRFSLPSSMPRHAITIATDYD